METEDETAPSSAEKNILVWEINVFIKRISQYIMILSTYFYLSKIVIFF